MINITLGELIVVLMAWYWPVTLAVAGLLAWAGWRSRNPVWRWVLLLLALAVASPMLIWLDGSRLR